MNLQLLFGLIGILLSFSLVFVAVKKQSAQINKAVQQSKVVVFLYVLAVAAFLSAFLNFLPTTSANNIRVDLVFVDFMFYPVLAVVVIVNLLSIRKNNKQSHK